MHHFKESQKFTQWWLWALIIASLVIPLALTFSGLQTSKQPLTMGNILIGCSIPAFIIILFASMRLTTLIDSTGIYYRFMPFHLKPRHIEWQEVEKAYIRTYSPIKEYGGWGIRKGLGKTGMAFNVSGSTGLQLELKDGQKILIGTQHPDDVTTLLRQLKKIK